MIRVTRRYRFAASHRLHAPELAPEVNREVYGKCNNPFGHGHDYKLEVTVAANGADPQTGRLIEPSALDRLVHSEVLSAFAGADLNRLEDFSTMAPTTENLTIAVERRLAAKWPSGWPRLDTIRIEETRRNHFELRR